MKKMFLLVTIFLLLGAFFVLAEDVVTPSVGEQIKDKVLTYIVYTIAGLFFMGMSTLFGYLAVKFPKVANYFLDLQEIVKEEIQRTEEKRKGMLGDLTAKQGIELKNETTERVMNTRVAQEVRRGIANLFGIFGGRSKEVGKQLFDSAVPGLIDKQVSKLKTSL